MPSTTHNTRDRVVASARFVAGDETDRRLNATLAHEMFRCHAAFQRFTLAAGRNVMGDRSREQIVTSHDAYADFLRHLYEFYVGCFKRDQWSDAKIHHTRLDSLFNGESEKLLRRKRDAIVGGYAPAWENDLAVYQIVVPTEFGRQFRRLRNAHSHASPKRVAPGDDWTLREFYQRCHLFVFLLYQCQVASWAGPDAASDLGEISRFDLSSGT
jgi:hypothetical protein